MAYKPLTRRGILATMIAAAATVVPLQASAAPAADTASVLLANSDARATITITKRIEEPTPSVRTPDSTSTPSAWTCNTVSGNKTIEVTCNPAAPAPSGDWVCPSVWVLGSSFGVPSDTMTGTAECGSTSVSCNPEKLLQAQSFCSKHADFPAPMPFRCKANYIGVTASDWTVTCSTRYTAPGSAPAGARR